MEESLCIKSELLILMKLVRVIHSQWLLLSSRRGRGTVRVSSPWHGQSDNFTWWITHWEDLLSTVRLALDPHHISCQVSSFWSLIDLYFSATCCGGGARPLLPPATSQEADKEAERRSQCLMVTLLTSPRHSPHSTPGQHLTGLCESQD